MSRFKRARKYFIAALLIAVLAFSILGFHLYFLGWNHVKADPGAYVGIAFCGNTTAQAKVLIDRVKDYTNLFILDSGGNPISKDRACVEEICDYAFSNGLSIIVNLGIKDAQIPEEWNWFWQQQSLDQIKQNWTERWGNKFLGAYYGDEPGGIHLDGDWEQWFEDYGEHLDTVGHPATDALNVIRSKMLDAIANGTKPKNYILETEFFVQHVIRENPGLQDLVSAGIRTYTSDYCLYWWDYMGGYDVLFAELGSNCSVAQQIASIKGAARMQDKEWGTIITWKYDKAPYLDSGEEIYNQMLTSYQAGADYIVIFNHPYEGSKWGAMTDEHFIALERFWNDITRKEFDDLSGPEAALVLPYNFGWGMRHPNDTIWGFWLTDDRTQQVATVTGKLLAQYSASLDIIYEDAAFPVANVSYKHVYYWNATDIQSNP